MCKYQFDRVEEINKVGTYQGTQYVCPCCTFECEKQVSFCPMCDYKFPHASQQNIKNEENICIICMSNDIEGAFDECGHMICCMSCSQNLKICPICRKNIIKTIKIYK